MAYLYRTKYDLVPTTVVLIIMTLIDHCLLQLLRDKKFSEMKKANKDKKYELFIF